MFAADCLRSDLLEVLMVCVRHNTGGCNTCV